MLQPNLPIHPLFFPHPLPTLMHPLTPFIYSLYWYLRSSALYLPVPIRLRPRPVHQFTDILDDARLYTPLSLWPRASWPFLPCPLPPFPHIAILTSPRHWLHLLLLLPFNSPPPGFLVSTFLAAALPFVFCSYTICCLCHGVIITL